LPAGDRPQAFFTQTSQIHTRSDLSSHPEARWTAQQTRNFDLFTDQEPRFPTHVIHDLETKFTTQFDAILAAENIEPVKVGPAAPNLNAHAERWVLSIKSES
jgi:hypothetical protein